MAAGWSWAWLLSCVLCDVSVLLGFELALGFVVVLVCGVSGLVLCSCWPFVCWCCSWSWVWLLFNVCILAIGFGLCFVFGVLSCWFVGPLVWYTVRVVILVAGLGC